MQVTCPCCATRFPLEAGFADDDGKRLAALLAGVEPALGRALVRYLRLFKPVKRELRSARAAHLLGELAKMVDAGTVCRDERGGVRRPATPALWAAGIEQMLADSDKLTLPLGGHNYLRAIVYGLADSADAAAERKREAQLRDRTPRAPAARQELNVALHEALARIDADLNLGLIQPDEANQRKQQALHEFGGVVCGPRS